MPPWYRLYISIITLFRSLTYINYMPHHDFFTIYTSSRYIFRICFFLHIYIYSFDRHFKFVHALIPPAYSSVRLPTQGT
ncbi:hypothetical protein DFH27DRAFT_548709 [Peziza echinospora]|nr:hypothetical protein DFH27DRAFT_548709 [Peziza echinospora]